MKLFKSGWKLGLTLMLLVFSFIGVIVVVNNAYASQTITYEQAQEKKDYWQTHGFTQYVPEWEGYKVISNREQEQERVEALIEFAEQLNSELVDLDTEGNIAFLVQQFNNRQTLFQEARRLGIDEQILVDLINRLKNLLEKNRLKIQFEIGELPLYALVFVIFREVAMAITLISFYLLEIYFPIFHVPVRRLCSSTCEANFIYASMMN